MKIKLLDEDGGVLHEFMDRNIDADCIIEWRKRSFSYSDSDGSTYIEFTQKPLFHIDG